MFICTVLLIFSRFRIPIRVVDTNTLSMEIANVTVHQALVRSLRYKYLAGLVELYHAVTACARVMTIMIAIPIDTSI